MKVACSIIFFLGIANTTQCMHVSQAHQHTLSGDMQGTLTTICLTKDSLKTLSEIYYLFDNGHTFVPALLYMYKWEGNQESCTKVGDPFLNVPPTRSHNDSFKYSSFPRAISEWNRLLDSTVSSECAALFLKNLKDAVLQAVV